MRRALLTPGAAGPFVIGQPDTTGTSNLGPTKTIIVSDNPAPRAGRLTSVTVRGFTAGIVNVMTGTLSGSSFTVADISGDLSMAAGMNTFAVSLSVPSGGVIGLWVPGSATAAYYVASGAVSFHNTLPSTKPSAGAVISGLSGPSGWRVGLNGTGS